MNHDRFYHEDDHATVGQQDHSNSQHDHCKTEVGGEGAPTARAQARTHYQTLLSFSSGDLAASLQHICSGC